MDDAPTPATRARCIKAWQAVVDLEESFGEHADQTIIEAARAALRLHVARAEVG